MWFINADKYHSFTFTPDAAKAIAILGNTPDAYNQVWHLPTDDKKITGREIAQFFMDEMKINKKVSAMPMWIIFSVKCLSRNKSIRSLNRSKLSLKIKLIPSIRITKKS